MNISSFLNIIGSFDFKKRASASVCNSYTNPTEYKNILNLITTSIGCQLPLADIDSELSKKNIELVLDFADWMNIYLLKIDKNYDYVNPFKMNLNTVKNDNYGGTIQHFLYQIYNKNTDYHARSTQAGAELEYFLDICMQKNILMLSSGSHGVESINSLIQQAKERIKKKQEDISYISKLIEYRRDVKWNKSCKAFKLKEYKSLCKILRLLQASESTLQMQEKRQKHKKTLLLNSNSLERVNLSTSHKLKEHILKTHSVVGKFDNASQNEKKVAVEFLKFTSGIIEQQWLVMDIESRVQFKNIIEKDAIVLINSYLKAQDKKTLNFCIKIQEYTSKITIILEQCVTSNRCIESIQATHNYLKTRSL